MKKLVKKLIGYPKNALRVIVFSSLVFFFFGLIVASVTETAPLKVNITGIVLTLVWLGFLFLLAYAWQDGWYKPDKKK